MYRAGRDRLTSEGTEVTADAGTAADTETIANAGVAPGRAAHPVRTHLAVLIGFIAAGVAVSWPRASYLFTGKLPAFRRDIGAYVWDFWWIARQVEHLSNPWFTRYLAAPVGSDLGYHALMPLPGLVLTPVTLAFGPSASFNLLSALMPGLLCYAMYRAARLWVPSQTGAIAAGAFFGLSSMLVYQSWYLINLAVGPVFIPIALEAAIRLRRRPARRQAVILGVIVAAALLTDQESTILVMIVLALTLVPWLAAHPAWAKIRLTVLAGLVAVVAASPQIVAMVQQAKSGGATSPPGPLAVDYAQSGLRFPGMFAPSPRVSLFGLHSLAQLYYEHETIDTIPTFGVVLTVLALAGLVLSWRRRHARLLALLWLGCAVLALGSVLHVGSRSFIPVAFVDHGVRISAVLPFTWLVKLPGVSGFREADRLTLLGIVPAALLAGSAVDWLRQHMRFMLIPVLVLGVLEAGWSGTPDIGTMPTAMPAVDRPIAADHSGSIVVDVPFGIKGGVPMRGSGASFDSEAEILGTADGHPRAVGFLARVPDSTLTGIQHKAFYAGLLNAQDNNPISQAQLNAARRNARQMGIGWIVVWQSTPLVLYYLQHTGFRFDYHADGVLVYRPA
ncbi:MAG TPA: hypothetical protein VGL63_12670 [Streptosporangiaceae bacterium]